MCGFRIVDDPPRFPNPGKERFIEHKLRMFGLPCENGKTVPVIKLDHGEKVQAGKWVGSLKAKKPLLIFHTACAPQWSHVRSRPEEWWKPIREALSEKFDLVGDSKTPLRTLAARYRAVGRYFGVNTGNWHLAMAVGCKCLVVDADACEGYDPSLWRYSLPNCEYVGFDVENVIKKISWLL